MSTAQAVRARIAKLPKGKPFTGERFLEHGSRIPGRGRVRRVSVLAAVRLVRQGRRRGLVAPRLSEILRIGRTAAPMPNRPNAYGKRQNSN